MRLISSLVLSCLCATLGIVAGSANAQQPATPPPAPKPTSTINPPASVDAFTSATVEQIMDQAVKNIARRYNLNDAQTRETSDLMKREVNRFLKEHEADVWPVLRDLIATQMKGAPETKEDAMKLGKAARPLSKLAFDAIFQANEEWRAYLDPMQKVTHDYDLQEMRTQFEVIDRNFEDLEKGTIPAEGALFPPPPPADRSPPRPKKPAEGLPEPQALELNIFENFVEAFIKECKLNQGQADAARSILNEYKVKAEAFELAKKPELAKLQAEQRAARDAHDRDRRVKAEKAKSELLAPVTALLGEFEGRLKGLLTSAQLDEYDSRHERQATAEERMRSESSRASASPATTRRMPPAQPGATTPATPNAGAPPTLAPAPAPAPTGQQQTGSAPAPTPAPVKAEKKPAPPPPAATPPPPANPPASPTKENNAKP